ncbi:3583_t:CDS:10, partial [Acaulospora morrowiae]
MSEKNPQEPEMIEKDESMTVVDISEKLETYTNETTINDSINNNDGGPVVQMSKTKFVLVFVGLTFGLFLAALDMTIVATALPAIVAEFNALDDISWVGTAYLLTGTAVQPTYGKISDIFGRKSTFLGAIITFELGSLLCGLSTNMTMLIISRAIAGIGGGGIFSLVYIIITEIVPIQDRGKYQGIVGGCFGFASVVGPLLGGIFTDHVTWRWTFYINLPLGAITVICVTLVLHLPHPKGSFRQKIKRIDWLGTVVVVVATVSVLLPLSWGGNKYGWTSPIVIVLFCVGGLGFVIFAYIEGWLANEPIAPGHLFLNRTVAFAYAVTLWHGMLFFSLTYFVPLYYQVVKGHTATQSGFDLLPFIFGVSTLSISTGQLLSRTDFFSYNVICLVGSVLMTIGGGLLSTLTETSNRGEQIGYLLIAGMGVGSIMQTILLAVQNSVERKDVASATSLLTFFRTMGAVFGVAILGAILNNELNKNLVSLIPPGISPEVVIHSGSLLNALPDSQKKLIVHKFVQSLNETFRSVIPMGVLCFVCVLGVKWLKPKINKSEETLDLQEESKDVEK